MRKSIFEILEENIDYYVEISRIEDLLSIETSYGWTLKSIIDINFLKWAQRKSSISVSDIYKKLGFEYITSDRCDLEYFLRYCEMISNIITIYLNNDDFRNDNIIRTAAKAVLDNIKFALSKVGYELYINSDKQIIVIETNSNASIAAESVDEQNAVRIMEYNRYILKGDLCAKKNILKNLADLFEGKRKLLEKNNLKSLADDIGFLLNNLDIRHNNLEGRIKNEWLNKIDVHELESWYDKTYKLIIISILSLEKIELGKDVKALKQEIEINKI